MSDHEPRSFPRDGRDEVDWAPRVPKHKIRRLYESDVLGLLDEDLLNDVGISLFLRCQSILDVQAARHGRIKCPRCAGQGRTTTVERPQCHGDPRDVLLVCPACSWQTTWGEYARTFKRKQLNAGGAVKAFEAFVRHYPRARSPQDKMLAIDRLIHEFHYSLLGRPDLPTRPVGVNLIEGKLTDVVQFLDKLAYGDEARPELQAWQQTLETWRGVVASWQAEEADHVEQ